VGTGRWDLLVLALVTLVQDRWPLSTRRKIPLIIGTAGQAGGDLNVDWTKEIVLEIARDKGYRPKIAVFYSEQSAATIKRKNAQGKITFVPFLYLLFV
jgi:hypothetical protein